MAKKKGKKVSNILDSYIRFKDMDDEEFRSTFGGTKDTIINSWLYLLYNDLKEQFETEEPDEAVEEPFSGDPEEEEEKKRERRETRRKNKRKKEEIASEDGSESGEETATDLLVLDEDSNV